MASNPRRSLSTGAVDSSWRFSLAFPSRLTASLRTSPQAASRMTVRSSFGCQSLIRQANCTLGTKSKVLVRLYTKSLRVCYRIASLKLIRLFAVGSKEFIKRAFAGFRLTAKLDRGVLGLPH